MFFLKHGVVYSPMHYRPIASMHY